MDFLERVKRHLADARERQRRLKSIMAQHENRLLNRMRNRPRRKPPEAGLAVPAVPPKGPLPMQGGAEAPLDFDD